MSIPVELHTLDEAIARYGDAAYLLTGAGNGRPHISHVRVRREGQALVVAAGTTTRANAAERPLAALLWSPIEAGGYSLIVDVDAALDGESLRLAPTRAVLHRPAPAPVPAGADCAYDCRPLEA